MARILLHGFLCERCDYQWAPRQTTTEEPKVCPNCKTRLWNKPRTQQRKPENRAAKYVHQPVKAKSK